MRIVLRMDWVVVGGRMNELTQAHLVNTKKFKTVCSQFFLFSSNQLRLGTNDVYALPTSSIHRTAMYMFSHSHHIVELSIFSY